jgi:hypothetical protein
MTINYTTLLGLVQPVDGTEVGVWGDDVNNGVSSILDIAVAGTQTLSSDANVTLTVTQATSSGTNLSGTSAQYAILLLTGARTAARTVTLPSASKIYLVINQTTGGFTTTFKGAATTGIAIVPGVSTYIAWNGSDFQGVSSVVGSLGFVDTGIVASYAGNVNSYSQLINQNTYNGTAASSDFIVSNNLGTATTYYGDFGMNSSGWSGSGAFNTANTVYLTSTSGDLALGTTTSNAIHFVVNGGTTDAMTINSSGQTLLPGGTANGVAYLNGSNVLTTGSALTFNGTNLSVPQINLSNAYGLQWGDASTYIAGTTPSGVLVFYTSNSEQMRLTTTGLGIGTSSPAYKLDVNGTANAFVWSQTRNFSNGTSAGAGWAIGNDTNATAASLFINSSTNTNFGGADSLNLYNGLNAPIAFYTNGTKQATLDANGNLGLGVTPSAWGAGYKSMQLYGGRAAYTTDSTQTWLSNNWYNNGTSDLYVASAAATIFRQSGGTYYWYTAPSGTANAAMSLTQAMTLDNSGNLMLGITSVADSPAQGLSLNNIGSVGRIAIGHANGTGGGNLYAQFAYNSSAIGSITQNGTTGVAYNTTSDIRLKNDQGVAQQSRINDVVIHDFTWKADGSNDRGVFAQELAEVIPNAVTKGQTEDDYWQVDYSKLVPDLIVEVQQLRARVAQLEGK